MASPAAARYRPPQGDLPLGPGSGSRKYPADLGFGQPTEHVLRQCLIAPRLADHAGLDDRDRMALYYIALLVNVGCHADAHEQAKWFGDDIALKSGKYVHEFAACAVRWPACGW
jgi:hypothetical protein